jgi:hypothetical protein
MNFSICGLGSSLAVQLYLTNLLTKFKFRVNYQHRRKENRLVLSTRQALGVKSVGKKLKLISKGICHIFYCNDQCSFYQTEHNSS